LLSAYGQTAQSELPATPVALRTTSHLPVGCLKSVGLLDVATKADGDWRGLSIEPFFVVQVVRFPNPPAARALAEHAVSLGIRGASGGIYSVTGPSLYTNDRGIVDVVAACLRK